MKKVMEKTMIRKVLFILIALVLVVSANYAAEDGDFKRINGLNYHKGMFDALQPEVFVKIPLGAAAKEVGGADQDPARYTSGVPFAFRPAYDGSVWILDSANKALKQFASDSILLKNISLEAYGAVVRDFAFDKKAGFWLLSPVEGFIYRVDLSGKLLSRIEGFADARALETGPLGELLVDMPLMSAVLRFGNDELLKAQYASEQGLTLIEGVGGKLLALEMADKKVSLMLRSVASPAQNISMAEFPLDITEPGVTYAGAQLLGSDQSGNLYLNLTACHEEGAIYRDRIYRCSPTGQILAQKDILSVPYLAPDLPRHKVVTADGKVMTFYLDGNNDYVLALYSL